MFSIFLTHHLMILLRAWILCFKIHNSDQADLILIRLKKKKEFYEDGKHVGGLLTLMVILREKV